MIMRYYIGLGMGHVGVYGGFTATPPTSTPEPQKNDQGTLLALSQEANTHPQNEGLDKIAVGSDNERSSNDSQDEEEVEDSDCDPESDKEFFMMEEMYGEE